MEMIEVDSAECAEWRKRNGIPDGAALVFQAFDVHEKDGSPEGKPTGRVFLYAVGGIHPDGGVVLVGSNRKEPRPAMRVTDGWGDLESTEKPPVDEREWRMRNGIREDAMLVFQALDRQEKHGSLFGNAAGRIALVAVAAIYLDGGVVLFGNNPKEPRPVLRVTDGWGDFDPTEESEADETEAEVASPEKPDAPKERRLVHVFGPLVEEAEGVPPQGDAPEKP